MATSFLPGYGVGGTTTPAYRDPFGGYTYGPTVSTIGGTPVTGTDIATTPPPTATPTSTATTTPAPDASNWEEISKRIDELNRQQQQISLAGRIPGGADLEKISSANIGGELRGEVPGDVKYLLQQQAAERGAAGGFGPGAFTNASYLRALGLTSLNRMAQGQTDLTAAEGRNPAAPLFDPSKMIITPYEQQVLAQRDKQLQLEAQRMQLEYMLGLRRGMGGGGGGGRGYGGGGGGYGGTMPTTNLSGLIPRSGSGVVSTSSDSGYFLPGGEGDYGQGLGYFEPGGAGDYGQGLGYFGPGGAGDYGQGLGYYGPGGAGDIGQGGDYGGELQL